MAELWQHLTTTTEVLFLLTGLSPKVLFGFYQLDSTIKINSHS